MTIFQNRGMECGVYGMKARRFVVRIYYLLIVDQKNRKKGPGVRACRRSIVIVSPMMKCNSLASARMQWTCGHSSSTVYSVCRCSTHCTISLVKEQQQTQTPPGGRGYYALCWHCTFLVTFQSEMHVQWWVWLMPNEYTFALVHAAHENLGLLTRTDVKTFRSCMFFYNNLELSF